jgi:hypothetical protein
LFYQGKLAAVCWWNLANWRKSGVPAPTKQLVFNKLYWVWDCLYPKRISFKPGSAGMRFTEGLKLGEYGVWRQQQKWSKTRTLWQLLLGNLDGEGRLLFRVTPAAREFLLRGGTNMKFGARHLKPAIERYVAHAVARLLATDQLRLELVCSKFSNQRMAESSSSFVAELKQKMSRDCESYSLSKQRGNG